jgi:hypothetical protein
MVTDGAANIVAASKELVGSDKHLHCLAHVLNLIVTDVFQTNATATNDKDKDDSSFLLPNLVKKIKAIATWFHSSNIAANELRKFDDLHIIQSVDTRWNSVYFMFKRAYTLIGAINVILENHPNGPNPITGSEKALMSDVIKTFSVFNEATQIASGENYVTLSKFLALIDYVRTGVESAEPSTAAGKSIKQALRNSIDRRVGLAEKHPLIAVSSLLDPRYKKIYFQNILYAAKGIHHFTISSK